MKNSHSIFSKILSIVGMFLLFLFFTYVNTNIASANDDLIVFTTDKPVYINGETVKMSWYINTEVQNCVITGPDLTLNIEPMIITTANLPVTGEHSYIPPDDSDSNFNLSCQKYTPVTVNPVTPSVWLSLDGNNSNITKYYDNDIAGVSTTTISWSSNNATRCSDVLYRSASTGNVWTTVSVDNEVDYNNRLGTSGWVRFDGDPRPFISETTEFGVTCYNDNENPVTSRWLSRRVTVNDIPPEPPPISVNLCAEGVCAPNSTTVTADLLTGYGTTSVSWLVSDADACEERAYTMDGVQINVSGWDFSATTFSGTRLIRLATTTKLWLNCWRNAQTYNNVTYPATSTLKELIIEVTNPFGGSMDDWDRSDPLIYPPVTVSATATPNPTYQDALTGKAFTSVSIEARNATYCYLFAYTDNDGDGVYSNIYNLSGWTRTTANNRLSGNYSGVIDVTELTQSSRLRIDCRREYDVFYGTPEEIENGTEVFDLIVKVLPPEGPAPDPVVYVYSNAVREITNDIWTKKTNVNGFLGVTNNTYEAYLYGTPSAVNRVSFPFTHPYGESDAYDVWFGYSNNIVPDGRIGIALTADNVNYTYFNGTYLGVSSSWSQLSYYTPQLKPGLNVIAVKGLDTGGVAGFLAALKWTGGTMVSDITWKVSTVEEPGWNTVTFDDSAWMNASTYGAYGIGPWGGVSGFLGGSAGAEWIWSADNVNDKEVYLRYSFYVDPTLLSGDGTERVYRFYDGAGQLKGTRTISGVLAPVSRSGLPTNERIRVASSVQLNDGDEITIECESGDVADDCPINRLFFGAGNNANVIARMDPVTEQATLQMLWISENTTSCTDQNAYNPITNQYLYRWSTNPATAVFETEVVATSTLFKVTCIRASDNTSVTSQVGVYVPFSSIYSVSINVPVGMCISQDTFTAIDIEDGYMVGPAPDYFCVPAVDYEVGSVALSLSGSNANNRDGTYNNAGLRLVIRNLGPGEKTDGTGLPYKFSIDFDSDQTGYFPWSSALSYYTNALAVPGNPPPYTESNTINQPVNNIPFGTHEVCARVNLDGDVLPESDNTNNSACSEVFIPIPPPPMSITTEPKLIRRGGTAKIEWSIDVTYEMDCTVRGPGGVNESFNTLDVGASYVASATTGPVYNASDYVFQCVETKVTGGGPDSTFTETVRLQVEPDREEI